MRYRLLRTLDPSEGSPADQPPAEPESAPTLPTAKPPPPPPGATVVLAGTKKEADVGEDLDKKKLQVRIAELEDERRRLLAAGQESQTLAPATEPEAKRHWLNGGSILD